MAVISLVHVNRPEAERLSDLYGIRFDFEAAQQYCAAASRFSVDRFDERPIVEGLVSAAVIRYTRPFSQGRRLRLDHERIFDGLSNDDRSYHDYFFGLRNWHIAHAINNFEQSFVTASIARDGDIKHPPRGVSPGWTGRLIDTNAAHNLSTLIDHVMPWLSGEIEAEEARVLQYLNGLPLDEVHAFDAYASPPDLDVSSQRMRFPRNP